MKYGIHWFRRDLRVAGNTALQKQFKENDGKVLGIFCFDKAFLSRDDFSVNRFQFFINSLISLKKELKGLGSDLLVLDVGPDSAFKDLFSQLEKHDLPLPSTVSWSRDYEPFARQRDDKMKDYLDSKNIEHFNLRDHLIIEPWELKKKTGEGHYQVYTPFSRRWLELFQTETVQKRISLHEQSLKYLNKLKNNDIEKVFKLDWISLFKGKISYPDHLTEYAESNGRKTTVEIPEAGSLAALRRIESFKDKIGSYKDKRDNPSILGTSKISPYLKNGSITIAQIIHLFGLTPYSKKENGQDVYFSELIWREFYYHILYHHPKVEKESFLAQYKELPWENNKDWFNAWKEGETGFPIVDAGMRELKETGWMHNRVRMIVASFLTKDLLIDWRWGEQYFMETLLDGDLAPNNGGWQWAASTGCDPQPYFRIFNPWSQSKKFDPDGEYIKKYIPELKDVSNKELHDPILSHASYPEPIIDHKTQRELALSMYKKMREKSE